MKLLIVTQKVDIQDDALGFFHRWIEEFATRFERVHVICHEEGMYHLPSNVRVHSLGKEHNRSVFSRVTQFLNYSIHLRHDYDVVFVDGEQHLTILGSLIWKIFGKKISLWRNQTTGSLLTRLAVMLSNTVFCTTPFAFVAPSRKTTLMPVGIDTQEFRPIGGARMPDSLLYYGKISSAKKTDVLIDALIILKKKNLLVSKTTFIGGVKSSDAEYFSKLKQKITQEKLKDYVGFKLAIPHHSAPTVVSQFEACINTAPSEHMDTSIFETMACETIAIVSNKALRGDIPDFLLFEEGNAESLSKAIEQLFLLSATERRDLGQRLRMYVVERHSLSALMDKLHLKLS
jgi:glycosyltransferase involved in cell wall biosynthesis